MTSRVLSATGPATRASDGHGLEAVLAVALIVWVATTAVAISLGGFEARAPGAPNLPIGIAAAVTAPLGAAVGLYVASPVVRDRTLALDARAVIAIQHARLIGVAFLFAWAWGELPGAFAAPAAAGDIATGVAAYALSVALLRGPLRRRRFWGFTAIGLGDFALAIVLGIVIQPETLDVWPMAFFPAFAIPFFAAVHLVSIAQLRHGRLSTGG